MSIPAWPSNWHGAPWSEPDEEPCPDTEPHPTPVALADPGPDWDAGLDGCDDGD